MSKLYIKDLERIKNGKIVRYNKNTEENYSSFISLASVRNEIIELRNIRFKLLNKFKNEVNSELDWNRGCKIDSSYKMSFIPTKLFLQNYLSLTIPTILGDCECLFDENGLVGTNGEITRDLIEKVDIIMPYVKKLFVVKNNSIVLNNEFYKTYPVLDDNNNPVFNINGDGIVLPYKEYEEYRTQMMQEILAYYYQNIEEILKNVLIPNTEILNNYRKDISKEKILKLYKGEK